MLGVIGVTVAALGMAEGACRLLWHERSLALNPHNHFQRDHPILLWTMWPDLDITLPEGTRLRTNALGLRSPPVTTPKPPGTTRILALGESTTWGHGVEESDAYPRKLEAALRAEGLPVEVVNAGVGAWTTWQSMEYFALHGEALEPDVVVAYHQVNDFLPMGIVDPANFLVSVDHTDRETIARRRRIAPLLWLAYRSRLYLALRKGLTPLPDAPDLPPGSWADAGIGVRVPEADRREAWSRLADECARLDATLVVAWPLYADSDQRRDDPVLRQLQTRDDIVVVDLPQAWQRAGRPHGQQFFHDEVHPSAAGHSFIAAELARALLSRLETVP